MNRQDTPNDLWHRVLHLGDGLFKLPTLALKVQEIEKVVDDLLHCNTEIIVYDLPESISQDYESVIDLENGRFEKGQLIKLPLVAHHKSLGILMCERIGSPFSQFEISLIGSLAFQASIIIENELLFERSIQQTNRLSTVAEIGNAITSILDLDLLLNSVVNLIQKYFNFPYVYVFTVHQWQNRIQLRAEGTGSLSHEDGSFIFEFETEDDFFSRVVRKRQTVITDEIHLSQHLAKLPPVKTKSELFVPLAFGGQALGILCLRSEEENAFSQLDVSLLETLGDNIAIALRNANLYGTELWRRRVAESMRDVAGLLSAEIDLTHLLHQLLEELTKTLPFETTAIWLIQNSESETGIEQYVSRLNLVALVTSNESLRSFLSQVEFFSTDQWIVDILESSYPLIHDNLTGIDPFGKLFSYGENYSAIISPLRVGLQPLGILVLSHPQPSRYGDEAQLIMSTFASYASVAIKNTQLYAAAHDQAWVSTVLLQVAEATQSINSLDELIHTVVHVIPQLVGVEACGILLWDRKIGSFTPYESFGLTPKQQDYFELWNFKENENPVFDHLLNSKEPVIMTQAMIGESQAKHLFSPFNLDREIFALFPMISQTDIQGAIIIDFSENISEYDYKLWEEKFLIIQGIAHQTAVAVENIKLIQSQEEEAYVSIALLQVAQAIVSANEIDDVLSVVVRITPILVAVKRCVIFLWDFTRNGFVLSQSYGISRSELSLVPKLLLPDSFPLLNEVRHRIQIACHLIKSDIFAFSEWSDLIIDDLLFLGNASQDRDDSTSLMTREVLSSKQGLLFAYPLAVKGVVYGIMVTEEELSERGTPSYHIRERRMEIITGITQQTALALQNDILQIEALIRERLDRELQLAREIQSNFMPEHLPYLPGWELNVKWKPARQVGGDYYDVIELPNGDIGLVIADVADKGMPAALFMTLVRTLLRATSRENKSPSRALKEINDLLVPDAKNGMFVTLFYGILNPDNGKFIYANAGHVPPILVSNNGTELIDLVPSGMALGVLPGISMEEKQLQLLPGDKLICYTDGVSEAFSAGGEMYGTFRLKNLISIESNKLSTSELLEAIVNEVYRFSDSSSLSDDLTLIAVCRKLLTQIEN